MKFYNFKVKWYIEEEDEFVLHDDYGIVFAGSMGEAVSRIEARFPDCDSVDIHYVDSGEMVFTTKEVYEKLDGDMYIDGEYTIGE